MTAKAIEQDDAGTDTSLKEFKVTFEFTHRNQTSLYVRIYPARSLKDLRIEIDRFEECSKRQGFAIRTLKTEQIR